MIIDPDFGSEEWGEHWLQNKKEEQFKEIMMLTRDALLLSAERDMFSINAILSVAIQNQFDSALEADDYARKRFFELQGRR